MAEDAEIVTLALPKPKYPKDIRSTGRNLSVISDRDGEGSCAPNF